jgi:hypothetical protein
MTVADVINNIPGIIKDTDHCHSIALVNKDGLVEVYSNHMDGFDYTNSFENITLCEKHFDYKKDICILDNKYVIALKERFKDVKEIVYWQF